MVDAFDMDKMLDELEKSTEDSHAPAGKLVEREEQPSDDVKELSNVGGEETHSNSEVEQNGSKLNTAKASSENKCGCETVMDNETLVQPSENCADSGADATAEVKVEDELEMRFVEGLENVLRSMEEFAASDEMLPHHNSTVSEIFVAVTGDDDSSEAFVPKNDIGNPNSRKSEDGEVGNKDEESDLYKEIDEMEAWINQPVLSGAEQLSSAVQEDNNSCPVILEVNDDENYVSANEGNAIDSTVDVLDNIALENDASVDKNLKDDATIEDARISSGIAQKDSMVEEEGHNISEAANEVRADTIESEDLPSFITVAEATDYTDKPSTSSGTIVAEEEQQPPSMPSTSRSVILSTHDMSVYDDNFKLTESELQLGKVKPYWIPDEDCSTCMLCSARFTLVNRRHHCRSCGRVLCGACCQIRRLLPYMAETEKKQRICTPCNKTLDRIECFERLERSSTTANGEVDDSGRPNEKYQDGNASEPYDIATTSASLTSSVVEKRKKSVLKIRSSSLGATDGGQSSTPPVLSSQLSVSSNPPEADNFASEANANTNFIATQAAPKRSVTFRDGIRPGDDADETSSAVVNNGSALTNEELSRSAPQLLGKMFGGRNGGTEAKKPIKRMSRRTMEKRVEEEHARLFSRPCFHLFRVVNTCGELCATQFHELADDLAAKRLVTIAIRRNLHVVTQLIWMPSSSVCITDDPLGRRLVISFSTRGFYSIGADELVFTMECRTAEARQTEEENSTENAPKDEGSNLNEADDVTNSSKLVETDEGDEEVTRFEGSYSGSASAGTALSIEDDDDSTVIVSVANIDDTVNKTWVKLGEYQFLEILFQIERLFENCTLPSSSSVTGGGAVDDDRSAADLDRRMGIVRCCRRFSTPLCLLNEEESKRLNGAAALLLHRSYGQVFGDIEIPTTPFVVVTLIKHEELPWARCVPNRVLLAIGKQASYYPTPVVNALERRAVFTPDATQLSVLKLLTDFRRFSYRLGRVTGSRVALRDCQTDVILPTYSDDELKAVIETNRNMVGWALDFNTEADSHLVCEQQQFTDSSTDVFSTQIFAVPETKRTVTGATFIIFDGALKASEADGQQFVVRVVEDGVIVRMASDSMEELVKCLLAGNDYYLESAQMRLYVRFVNVFNRDVTPLLSVDVDGDGVKEVEEVTTRPSTIVPVIGALLSPIDGQSLAGRYQYGFVLSRALRSINYFPSANEWALRMAAVMNMNDESYLFAAGKFPSLLQSKYFEICEQLVALLTQTLDPLVKPLVEAGHRILAIRVSVDEESALYRVAPWPDALEVQHYLWTMTLDEQLVPYLYNLCSWMANNSCVFQVEIHMSVISTRPLPYCCPLGSTTSSASGSASASPHKSSRHHHSEQHYHTHHSSGSAVELD